MTKQIHPGEPSFDDVLMPDKIDYIRALNFYSFFATEADVREWTKGWCTQRGLDLRLRGRTFGELISLAAFFRMQERGLVIEDALAKRIDDGFKALHIEVEPRPEDAPAKVKTVSTSIKPIECISKLDAYLDSIILGDVSTGRIPNFCESRKDVNLVTEACKHRAQRLEEDREGYSKEGYKVLKNAYASILKSLATAAEKIATEKTKAVIKSKPASVIAKGVKYAKEFGKIRGMTPDRMVGAKKAYVFDKADRRLIVFVATEAGFTFTGTTLKNIDTSKSFKKTVRKPEEMFDGMEITMSQLNKTYGSINAKEQSVVGRFSEDHVILCIGGF